MSLKPSHKRKREEMLPNSIVANIALILKPDKETTKVENFGGIFLVNIDINILNKLANNNSSKISYTVIKLVPFHGCKDGSMYTNQSM
jgi:hypothetical protein